MFFIYPACFYKEKEGGYSVIFPDLNHLATCGDTLDESFNMARDCLEGYLRDLNPEDIPAASAIQDIDVNVEYDEYEYAFTSVVIVDIEDGRSEQHE